MKNYFFIFSKWRILFNRLLFSGKTAFLQISADFVTEFKKIFFHLKARQTRMQIDVKKFVAQVVPAIYAKNFKFQKQLDVYFCYSL